MSEIENKKVSELIPDDRNANLGTLDGARSLQKSLKNYGLGRSILIDKKGRIIAGNKTFETANELGIEDVIVVKSDGKKIIAVQRDDIDLDSKKGRELALVDNKSSELNLDWDIEQIESIQEDFDININELDFLSKDLNDIDVDKSTDEKQESDKQQKVITNTCPNCNFTWESL